MSENKQFTLTEQEGLFGILVKDKPYCAEERGVYGAKVFKRRVAGICGKNTRTERQMLDIVTENGLAENDSGAREFLDALENRLVVYEGDLKDWEGRFYERPGLAKCFRLERLGEENRAYRMVLVDNTSGEGAFF